uniref:C-type lectin domain-containing protein n=1 Tax=Poecilia mexicana TaxID=48701 RepID=A0A3B3YYE1_9TELE
MFLEVHSSCLDFPDVSRSTRSPPRPAICLPGWQSFNGSCYWIVSNVNQLTTWYEAVTKCSAMGAHLLFINSQEEQFFINGKLPDFHQVDIPDIWIGEAWVGLNDINIENQFVYTDGSDVDLLPWAENQPDNWENNEDCIHLTGMTHPDPGKINDDKCTATREFVCKKGEMLIYICTSSSLSSPFAVNCCFLSL